VLPLADACPRKMFLLAPFDAMPPTFRVTRSISTTDGFPESFMCSKMAELGYLIFHYVEPVA
jgi:hypothetical protein